MANHDELIRMKLAKLARLESEMEERKKLPHLHMHKWYPWSREVFENREDRVQVLCSGNQVGKLVLDTQEIPTPEGFKLAKDIEIGSMVLGDDGQPCVVEDIPYIGPDNGYLVEFDDDTSLVVGANHLWRCKGQKQRYSKGEGRVHPEFGQWVVRSTEHIFKDGKYGKDNRPIDRYVVPYCAPVEYPHKDLFDPYALGVLLGDGSFGARHCVTVTNPEPLIKEYFEAKLSARSTWHDSKNCYAIRVPVEYKRMIEHMGLIHTYSDTKFVPQEYMTASVEQRLALLQGLMDTDGTANSKGDGMSFSTASPMLAAAVRELVFSLGGTSKHKIRQTTYSYKGEKKSGLPSNHITIKLPPYMSPFRLARNKLIRWQKLSGDIRYKHERVIYKVTPVGKIIGRCFSVSSPNKCFIAGKNYVVTHNSSVMIKKVIDMATTPDRWPEYWPTLKPGQVPGQWWCAYPTKDVATTEFYEKWKPLLPQVDEDDPKYGWKETRGSHGIVSKLSFNTGVTIYFKAYKQEVSSLQSGSVFLLYLDEECPTALLPELQMRTNATNGFQFYAFTATLGQKHWRQVVEERSVWPYAKVVQVGLNDCQVYDDGTPSMWTTEKIQRTIESCASPNEIQKRVFGRFVLDSGLMYPQFDSDVHVTPFHRTPAAWDNYAGIDYGTGGTTGHPATIVIIAVNPERTQVRMIRAWRGDKTPTTAQDIVNKFMEMAMGLRVVTAYYDYGPGGRDVGTIANRLGLPFEPANKGSEHGRSIIQSLLKNKAIKFYEHTDDCTFPAEHLETPKLIEEFVGATIAADKRFAKLDDLLDALRYALSKIPWNWEAMMSYTAEAEDKMVKAVLSVDAERASHNIRAPEPTMDDATVDEEMEFWQEQFEI